MNQSEVAFNLAAVGKRGKRQETILRLVLVLHLIGWENNVLVFIGQTRLRERFEPMTAQQTHLPYLP